MTVARVSQSVLEVLRTNTAVKAQLSQVVIEVLRVNGAETPISGTTVIQFVIAT